MKFPKETCFVEVSLTLFYFSLKGTGSMAEKTGDRTAPKINDNSSHQTTDDIADGPPPGWRGFERRRGSFDFLFGHNQEIKPPASTKRKTSLTPEMEIPSSLTIREDDSPDSSPGTSPSGHSIMDIFMKRGMMSMNAAIQEVEQDDDEPAVPPSANQPRRPSLTRDAMQWFFKPMNIQSQVKERDLNALVPTST